MKPIVIPPNVSETHDEKYDEFEKMTPTNVRQIWVPRTVIESKIIYSSIRALV